MPVDKLSDGRTDALQLDIGGGAHVPYVKIYEGTTGGGVGDASAATESTLVQVRDAIKAQIDIASTVWTDNSDAYYVRRDLVNEGTGAISVAFTDATGNAATPGAGLKPLASAAKQVTEEVFDATAAGTGYTSGDILARVLIVDTTAAIPTTTAIWVNLMSGAVIAAPTSGTFERANESIGARQIGAWSMTVPGVATAALQTAGNTSLSNIDADIGAKTDLAYTDITGASSGSVVGVLKGLLNRFNGLYTLGNINLNSTGNRIGNIVGQGLFEATYTITRPANTTAYVAGQLISTAITGLTALPAMALGIGNNIRFAVNGITVISSNGSATTKAQLAAYLFNSSSPSGAGFNDAAAFAPTAAALAATGTVLAGVIPSSLAQSGTAAYGYTLQGQAMQGVTDASGNTYPAIVNMAAYTPASGETITIKVTGTY